MTDSRSLDGESHWEVARTGWSSAGWSEADPSPEEAMAALASMRPTGAPCVPEPPGDGQS